MSGMKVRGILGDEPEDDKDIVILNRRLVWKADALEYEADPKHVWLIAEALGLNGVSNGLEMPIAREEKDHEKCDEEKLDKTKATQYRAIAARANYLAQDRFDIQFAAKQICREMSSPTVGSWRRLKRLGRYLLQYPTVTWRFEKNVGIEGAILDTFTDSDWAGCTRSRRSTSAGLVVVNGCLVKSWSSTQSTIALSSGEAEYYAAVKAAAEALAIQRVAAELGWQLGIRIWIDSSAAKSISSRIGIGKVRHLEVKYLWLQDALKAKRFEMRKIHGRANPSDIGTKPVNAAAIREALSRFCKIQRRQERQ